MVTAVAAFLDLDRQAQLRFDASLQAREITIMRIEDDQDIFRQAPAKRVGNTNTAPVTFTFDDLKSARAAAPKVSQAYLLEYESLLKQQDLASEIRVAAVTPDYLSAAQVKLQSGSLFTESDFRESRNLMLLYPATARLLELNGDPVGQSVVFNGTPGQPEYLIVGIIAASESSTNYDALIPYGTVSRTLPNANISSIRSLKFAVANPAQLPEARAELAAFAAASWGLDRVSVRSGLDDRVFRTRQRVTSLIIAVFASVGLVVASLNIMNLMLTRVLKTQRMLGIYRTLGATRSALRNQVLSDALLLGSLGGLVGIPAGYGLLAAYNRFLDTNLAFNLTLSPMAILIGIGLAVGMSLLFGLYPAILAARVRVVETLRSF